MSVPRFVVHPDARAKKPIYLKVTKLQEDRKEREFLLAEFSRIEGLIRRAQSYVHVLGLIEDYNFMLSAFQAFQLKWKAKLEAQKEMEARKESNSPCADFTHGTTTRHRGVHSRFIAGVGILLSSKEPTVSAVGFVVFDGYELKQQQTSPSPSSRAGRSSEARPCGTSYCTPLELQYEAARLRK